MRVLANGKKASNVVLFEGRFDVVDTNDPLGDPIRTRWRLFHCRYFGVYLHKWLKPDSRKDLHNHPWPFVSVVLKGAYIEENSRSFKWNYVNWFNYVPRGVYHTVQSVHPSTWTLMLVGPTHKSWGYLDVYGEHVPFDKHPSSKEFSEAMKLRNKKGQEGLTN